jgi:ribonuclease P protein component
MGVVVPKRWAKRAVTRNGIKRQIYSLSETFEARLPHAAHVVRLRSAFAREKFPSAWSEALKGAVRAELLQLFGRAVIPAAPAVVPATPAVIPASPSVIPAKAGIQGSQAPNAEALDSRLRGNDGVGGGNDGAST